jgi:predicted dehydrogenase
MSKTGPVKVAMIGLGWWGKKMTAVLQQAKADIEIACAAEPNPAGNEFATANGFTHTPTTRRPSASGVEAVILATPHSAPRRADRARRCAGSMSL